MYECICRRLFEIVILGVWVFDMLIIRPTMPLYTNTKYPTVYMLIIVPTV